jgi:hypothetical protein
MEKFSRVYPVIFLLSYLIKSIVSPVISIADAIVVVSLIGLIALQELKLMEKKEKELKTEFSEKISVLEKQVADLIGRTEEITEVRQHLASIKMGQQVNAAQQQTNFKNMRF